MLERLKLIDASPEEIAAAARLAEWCGGGGKKRGPDPPWDLLVIRKTIATVSGPFEKVDVKFRIREQPVLGLDYHLRPVRNDDGTLIPAGYHWDLHRPLSDYKTREIPERQPLTPAEAVKMMMSRAKIVWQNSLELPP